MVWNLLQDQTLPTRFLRVWRSSQGHLEVTSPPQQWWRMTEQTHSCVHTSALARAELAVTTIPSFSKGQTCWSFAWPCTSPTSWWMGHQSFGCCSCLLLSTDTWWPSMRHTVRSEDVRPRAHRWPIYHLVCEVQGQSELWRVIPW